MFTVEDESNLRGYKYHALVVYFERRPAPGGVFGVIVVSWCCEGNLEKVTVS